MSRRSGKAQVKEVTQKDFEAAYLSTTNAVDEIRRRLEEDYANLRKMEQKLVDSLISKMNNKRKDTINNQVTDNFQIHEEEAKCLNTTNGSGIVDLDLTCNGNVSQLNIEDMEVDLISQSNNKTKDTINNQVTDYCQIHEEEGAKCLNTTNGSGQVDLDLTCNGSVSQLNIEDMEVDLISQSNNKTKDTINNQVTDCCQNHEEEGAKCLNTTNGSGQVDLDLTGSVSVTILNFEDMEDDFIFQDNGVSSSK